MTHSTAVEVALIAVNLTGCSVFPVNPTTKAPYYREPFATAARSEQAIIDLFGCYPTAVPAIPCGPQNGITVIDVDRKNGVDGIASLRALGVDLPCTDVVSTPTGGVHIYYRTKEVVYPCSVGKLGPGLDVRGDRGYVIAPGAETPIGKYTWRSDLFGPEWAPAAMPIALSDLILKPARPQRLNNGTISLVRSRLNAPIFEGNRNAEFASRIGYLLRHVSLDETWRIVRHLNDTVTHPPLPERELRRILESINRREARK